ncbi:MAG: HK97 family phage prohead protease [Erysipelotrichaceae bacterium]|nr:HK97 family phage prohead protease [Erysipelotrichaceae bacterium]MBP3663551.1 HK97 family phage prohead protease [Tyzzerella sp.]
MKTNEITLRSLRPNKTQFQTRDDGDKFVIEGYFAVFNSNYDIFDGLSESIAPEAFDNTLNNDIRALINHDTTLVVGRTKAGTLELRTDNFGLFGRISINPKDLDAVNAYERVKRGDVDQCSIGFNIIREESEVRPDGAVHWTIRELELFEVSICTFPAYEETEIQARSKQAVDVKARQLDSLKESMRKKLRKEESNA